RAGKNSDKDNARFPAEPQENILYFLEKHAPLLEPWQREIVRIVRKIAQFGAEFAVVDGLHVSNRFLGMRVGWSGAVGQ
ncbi:SpoVR family protein, partial [Pseudomonas sp. SIMBA_064]